MRQSRTRQIESNSSPAAFSYHSNRSLRTDNTNQSRGGFTALTIESSKSVNKTSRWLITIVLLAVLILVLIATRVSTAAKLDIIQPTGFNYMPHSLIQYQKAAAAAIGSSIYNQDKLTLSSDDIALLLEKRFPEIGYAAVTVPFIGATPTVHIELVSPALIYSTSTLNYVLDSNGNIIGTSNILNSSEISNLPVIQSSISGSFSDGSQVLTNSNVLFIRTVKAALDAKAIKLSKMQLVPQAEELDVYPLGQPYFVKFNLHETDALQQVGTYLAALATLKSKNQIPKQYIDVRVDGRAYYK